MKAILLAAALLALSPAAAAQTGARRLVTATDANGLAAALQRAGFTGEVKREEGQSYVLARLDGLPFQAFLAGCQPSGAACTVIELHAGFSNVQRFPWERINGWNARTPFARAFLDEKRNPSLVMNINLEGGVSPDSLKAQLEMWGEALETFALFLQARVPPVGAVAAPEVQSRAPEPKR